MKTFLLRTRRRINNGVLPILPHFSLLFSRVRGKTMDLYTCSPVCISICKNVHVMSLFNSIFCLNKQERRAKFKYLYLKLLLILSMQWVSRINIREHVYRWVNSESIPNTTDLSFCVFVRCNKRSKTF